MEAEPRLALAGGYNNATVGLFWTEGYAMPIHDWTRVTAGTWHDFHLAWMAEIRNVLNSGILPADYYAQAEQIAGPLGPDVLTLQMPDIPTNGATDSSVTSGGASLVVRMVPPQMRVTAEA